MPSDWPESAACRDFVLTDVAVNLSIAHTFCFITLVMNQQQVFSISLEITQKYLQKLTIDRRTTLSAATSSRDAQNRGFLKRLENAASEVLVYEESHLQVVETILFKPYSSTSNVHYT
jgi:hypothetical protein